MTPRGSMVSNEMGAEQTAQKEKGRACGGFQLPELTRGADDGPEAEPCARVPGSRWNTWAMCTDEGKTTVLHATVGRRRSGWLE